LKTSAFFFTSIFLLVAAGCNEPAKHTSKNNEVKNTFYSYSIPDNMYRISLDMPSFLKAKFADSPHTTCFSHYCLKDSTGYEYFYLSFDQAGSIKTEDMLRLYGSYSIAGAGDDLKKTLTSRALTIDTKSSVFNDCLSKEKGRRYYRGFAAIYLGNVIALLHYRISELNYRADPSMIFQSVNSFKLNGIDSTGKIYGLEM
jgi:hypothetical protein